MVALNSSSYALYVQERLGLSIIEDERGFVTFEIMGGILWIRDMFVKKEYRQQGVAREWIESLFIIANDNQCTQVSTHVCINSVGWDLSFKLMVGFGFIVVGQVDSLIYLTYNLGK